MTTSKKPKRTARAATRPKKLTGWEKLTGSERAAWYVDKVLRKEQPAPETIVMAADHWNQAHKEYAYNPKQVDARVRLIEKLELPEVGAGKFILLPWQAFLVSFVYGFSDEHGRRAYRRLLLECPRKSGKTSLMSGIAIGELIRPFGTKKGELANKEIICAGVNDETAGFAYSKAIKMIEKDRRSPDGGVVATDYGITCNTNQIKCEVSGGLIRRVTTGARSLEGHIASTIVFDEISQLPDPESINKLRSGLVHDPQHLLLMCSTQGELPVSALTEEREKTIGILKEKLKKNIYIGLHYSAEKNDRWDSELTWAKVQPRLYELPTMLSEYKAECELAKIDDKAKESFLLRQLCFPGAAGGAFVTVEAYDALPRLERDWPLPELAEGQQPKPQKHYLGIDLSDAHDSTALCLLSVNEDNTWEARFRILHCDGLGELKDEVGKMLTPRKKPPAVMKRYEIAAKNGDVLMTAGPTINHRITAEAITEIANAVTLNGIFSDKQDALPLVREYLDDDIAEQIYVMSPHVGALTPCVKEAEAKIKNQKLSVSRNTMAREQWLNAVAEHRIDGGIKIRKNSPTSPHHIDSLSAFLHAVLGKSHIETNEKFYGTPLNPIDVEAKRELKVDDFFLE